MLTSGNISLTAEDTYELRSDSYCTFPIIHSPYIDTSLSIYQNPQPIVLDTSGIKLNSDHDIMIGNISLKQSIENIEKRLAILNINTTLEAEFEELKQLGDQYRSLEDQIYKKLKMWDILKKDD